MVAARGRQRVPPEPVAADADTVAITAQTLRPTVRFTVTAEVAKAVAEAPEEPGNLTKLVLSSLGRRPYKAAEVVPAWWRLKSTHESVTGVIVNSCGSVLLLLRGCGSCCLP